MMSQFLKLYDDSETLENARQKATLEPKEFCLRWVKTPNPGARGYYTACVRDLAKATGLSERTIEGWGPEFRDRPDYILVVLEKENTIRQIRQLVQLPPEDPS
ncbi:hypothetical protein [Planktothrix sp. FACHB-1365]|uniref:hypothetical protein n=1 Tax=Planktothrix sp. FACHB-1365 TaxID=2692855 RepID=UPI001A7EAEE5|nr:hypothetical protein [Planktothrix sp. FACHB-1365]